MEQKSLDINNEKLELLNAMFNSSPDALVFVSEDKIVRFFNKKAEQLTMEFYEREMSIGSSIYNYLLEKDIKLFDRHFQAAFEKSSTKQKPFKISENGKYLEFYFQALSSASGVKGVSLTVRDVTREQHLAEAHKLSTDALRQSEQRYKMLVENAFDAIYLIRNYNFEYINKRYEELTGYSSEEVLAPDFDINCMLTPKSKAIMEERYEARKNGEKLPSQYEFQVKSKSGNVIDVEITTAAVSENDEVLVLGIMRDVSDRLSVRAALENEKAYFKHLFESLPFGVVVLNQEDSVLDCNSAFLTMFKLEIEHTVNSKINDLIVPDFLKAEGNALTNDIILGKVIARETTRITSDGNLLQVAISGQPITMPDGSQIIFGTYQNITRRKKTERALQQERKLMNALMDNIPDTIYFKDTASNFTRINKAQQKALGVKTAEDAMGKSDFDFFDQAHAQKSFEEERSVMSRNKPLINKIEKLKTSDGWKWFSATKVPLKNDDNDIIGLAGISRDITEMKLMEEVLRQNEQYLQNINAEKDKLFSIIAHDLRSPFNSFIMLTDMFIDKEYDLTVNDMKSIALSMKKSASNLTDLLDNLLDWSRIQRGLFNIQLVEIELFSLVLSAIEPLNELVHAKQIKIENTIDPTYQLYADRSMLNSVVRNLLSNAIKFTPNGGQIFINAKTNADWYAVSIGDNGIGMPEKIKNNLFKIDGKTGRKGTEGEATSGLGLILVKEFLEKLDGYIEVQSEENKGSVFTAYLPKKESK